MKKIFLLLLVVTFGVTGIAQNLKPYILGFESGNELAKIRSDLKSNLKAQGFNIQGEYQPAADANRWLIVVGHPDLTAAVKQIGGLTAFAATLRVGITKEGGAWKVTYTNPKYWGNAYFRDNYPKVENHYNKVTADFEQAMKNSGNWLGTSFGSKTGISVSDLRDYQYMFGMPDFDDTNEVGDFDSFEEAVAKIDANLKAGVNGARKVYSYKIPGKNLKVYGIALTGSEGEKDFLPTIDISSPKHTAFLPYELLVLNDEAVMLHGRFRIALSFPDLTMGTFTKIMSAPGNIEDKLEEVCH